MGTMSFVRFLPQFAGEHYLSNTRTKLYHIIFFKNNLQLLFLKTRQLGGNATQPPVWVDQCLFRRSWFSLGLFCLCSHIPVFFSKFQNIISQSNTIQIWPCTFHTEQMNLYIPAKSSESIESNSDGSTNIIWCLLFGSFPAISVLLKAKLSFQ